MAVFESGQVARGEGNAVRDRIGVDELEERDAILEHGGWVKKLEALESHNKIKKGWKVQEKRVLERMDKRTE